jgi:hypothetical protein
MGLLHVTLRALLWHQAVPGGVGVARQRADAGEGAGLVRAAVVAVELGRHRARKVGATTRGPGP